MFVALPFVVFAATGGTNERVLAVTFLFGSLPRLLALPIGSVVDRLSLKALLITTGILRSSVFIVLAILVTQGIVSKEVIYIVAFFNGLLASFVQTANNVLLPELVAKTQLTRANSLMQIAHNGVPLLGYGLAGVLVASFGGGITLLMAGLFFAVLPFSIAFIRFPLRELHPSRPFSKDVLDGVTTLFRNKLLILASLAALLLNGTMMLLNVLIPGTMMELGWGARGYGIFEALFGVGAMLGIAAIGMFLSSTRLADQISISLGCSFISSLLFAIGSPGWFYFLGALLLGFSGGLISVAIVTLFQSSTTQENRGKVLGSYGSIDALGFILGPSLAGWLAPIVADSVLYSACALLIAFLTLAFVRSRHLPVEAIVSEPTIGGLRSVAVGPSFPKRGSGYD